MKIVIGKGSKTARNRKRRKSYKRPRMPHHMKSINGFVLVLKYADSFRSKSQLRSLKSEFIKKRLVQFGLRRLRLRSLSSVIRHLRPKRCLGFVVHSFGPVFYDKSTGVTQIQGAKYAQEKKMGLPLPVNRRLISKLRRYWYSMTENMTNRSLWDYQARKHGVYFQLVRTGSYWRCAMKLAMRFLSTKSKKNLINLISKAGYQLNHPYNCKKFVAFLKKVLGARVKANFKYDQTTQKWYLDEIHLLFDLNLNLIPYILKKRLIKYTKETSFVLESYQSRHL